MKVASLFARAEVGGKGGSLLELKNSEERIQCATKLLAVHGNHSVMDGHHVVGVLLHKGPVLILRSLIRFNLSVRQTANKESHKGG